MRRRLVSLIAAVMVVALAVTAVALAQGGRGDKPSQKSGKERHAVRAHDRGGAPAGLFGQGIAGMVLDSLAGRLEVKPADLRTAVTEIATEQRDKYLKAAGLTPAELTALQSCRGHHKADKPAAGATCDQAAAKSARDKLRAAPQPDLAQLKSDAVAGLATRLGKTPEAVTTAVRAELVQRLGQAVTIGWITQKGSDLALGCFDTPASCDLKALRAEVKFFGHAGRKGHR